MAYTTDQKTAAVYRVTVDGHQAQIVAKELGCSRTTLRKWCHSKPILSIVANMRRDAIDAMPASDRPLRAADPTTPILGDVLKARLMAAVRDGLPLVEALPLVRLSPRAPDYWQERADAGDLECRAMMLDFAQARAEFMHRMMVQACSMDRGARNAQWALRCHNRETFGEHAPDTKTKADPLEAYTDAQLDAVINAAE